MGNIPHGEEGWRPGSRQHREKSASNQNYKKVWWRKNYPTNNKQQTVHAWGTADRQTSAHSSGYSAEEIYTKEAEAKRINKVFCSKPHIVYSQWLSNNTEIGSPRGETIQCWKYIWEKEASHNTNAQWLVDLRADHNNLPEQESVTITMADIQDSVQLKGWAAPGPRADSPDHQTPPEGSDPIQHPLHKMEAPFRQNSS